MLILKDKLPLALPKFLTRPLSFSSMLTFSQCPKKFKYKYIDNVTVVERQNESLKKGKQAHEILAGENARKAEGSKSVVMYTQYPCEPSNTIADFIKDTDKELHLIESKIMLDGNLNPTSIDKDAIIIGYIDSAVFKNGILEIIDYKTGWSKGKKSQLLLYATYLVPVLKPKTTFVKFIGIRKRIPNKVTQWLIDNNDIDKEKDHLIETIETIRNSDFKEIPNWCCKYCEYSNHCLSLNVNGLR